MKRFWLVLLSLGLIMAFSASAFAVDVKLSGDIDFAGLYLNKTTLNDSRASYSGGPTYDRDNPSTAFFYQRLRFGADFIVAPCLKLVTQFDAMDRIWGGARGGDFASYGLSENTGGTAGTRAESQNFVMNLAYVEYTSPIGLFKVGYQKDWSWGTVFGDRSNGMPAGQITYIVPVGPVVLIANYAKQYDESYSAVTSSSVTDSDMDSYRLAAIYKFKDSEVGALFNWTRNATNKSGSPGSLMNAYNILPYFKATIGPVAIQGELNYGFGDAAKWEDGGFLVGPGVYYPDVTLSTLSVFLDATVNLGMVYVGGSFAYVSGDDPGTTNKIEGGVATGNTGGLDWNPCLIMFNTDLEYWAGDIYGHSDSVLNGEMANAWFFQGRVGVKPIPALDIMGSVSFATADKKPDPKGYDITYGNGNYGVEIDVTGTYKITNNLSYMLCVGYLFTGDYFKGYDYAGQNYKIVDDYMLINKLVLSF